MKHLALSALLVLLIAGFRANAQTTLQDSFLVDGMQRSFILYVPASYAADTPAPLVLNLHGYGSNFLEQMFYGEFRPIADTAGFLIVHPNGTPDQLGNLSWNNFGLSTVDDIGFLSQLIDSISSNYSIDANRVYSTGMSNGGFMSYDLACNLSGRIAAVASVTGSMILPNLATCNATHSTPVMQIHGTIDSTVPYAGNAIFTPIDTLVKFWRELNNCDPVAELEDVPNTSTTDNCTAEHYVWNNGDAGSSVEFYKILGGDHSWPGAIVNINTTNMDFSASREIWRFFSQYRLDQLITQTPVLPDNDIAFTVFPNPTQDVIHVQFSSSASRKIRVIDITGREIKSFACSDNRCEITLEERMIYMVQVNENGRVTTKRVVNM
jgi:polyhydroxybutyrate depolymerase